MRRATAAATAVALLALAGCGEDTTTLRVLAASSLTDAFEDIADTYEADHPGVDVEVITGSSTALAEQAADGAPGDVLATADEDSMLIAADAGAVAGYGGFATNVLVIVTPPDDPAGVTTLQDLEGSTWVRCADEAPCGKAARALLGAQGVDADPASLEEDARSTLDKVVSGEADAALVYASDAVSAGSAVSTVPIRAAQHQRTTYFVGPLTQAADTTLAQEFVNLVLAEEGQEALAEAGFGTP